MRLTYYLVLVALFLCSVNSSAQTETQDTTIFPYILPIWGQKVHERGMADQLQLPFGVNLNYINAYLELEITDFTIAINGNDLTNILNTETLNFQEVSATTNGLNIRADAWVLPFMNVYGLFSSVVGGTSVSLAPQWKDATGEVILALPEFSSNVEFDAIAYGLGTTLIFGWDGYFTSVDLNFSLTDTELLDDNVGYLNMSSRMGYRFLLDKKVKERFVAPYFGIMYRNFTGADGSNGHINMSEVFPDLDESFNTNLEDKLAQNQAIIDDPSTSTADKIKLQAQNQALETIGERINESGVFTADIDYFIEKDLIQTVTFQFGFNFQINRNWMLRGEYGIADSQRFLMTGIQYRFGIKKKGLN